jgi:hypothetical protein
MFDSKSSVSLYRASLQKKETVSSIDTGRNVDDKSSLLPKEFDKSDKI